MDLPVMPPVRPMLAKATPQVPTGGDYAFEPKWDGFRCLVFKDGDEVELTSRNTKPLTRYFPEIVEAMRDQLPPRCVLDGEVFVALTGSNGLPRLEFEVLQERIHPAKSRVEMLAAKTPAAYVAFDLLALGETAYVERPYHERRAALENALADLDGQPRIIGGEGEAGRCYLTRITTDPAQAQEWFETYEGAGLDGVIAKPLGAAYTENARTMLKVKHERTADVVVAGMREHKNSTAERPLLGSLLLGLYDDAPDDSDGAEGGIRLQHIGVSASFTEKRRAELWDELIASAVPLEEHPWGHWAEWLTANPDRVPGTQSRWSQGKDLSFIPLRPDRVLEVKYDHMEGRRFRHTAHFKRWRPDREPEGCRYDQLDEPVRYDLSRVLGVGS